MTLNLVQLSYWEERQKWSQNNINNTKDMFDKTVERKDTLHAIKA